MTRFGKSIILVVSLIAVLGFAAWTILGQSDKPETQPTVASEETSEEEINVMTNVDPKEIEEYRMVYKNPYVISLRTALNAYSAGDWQENGVAEAAVTGIEREGITSGLDSFDKEYFESKFWVATIDDSIAGGKDIQIIFQDRPDKMFYAWVYKLNTEGGEDEFELRGFSSRDDISADYLQEFLKFYDPLLNEEDLAI